MALGATRAAVMDCQGFPRLHHVQCARLIRFLTRSSYGPPVHGIVQLAIITPICTSIRVIAPIAVIDCTIVDNDLLILDNGALLLLFILIFRFIRVRLRVLLPLEPLWFLELFLLDYLSLNHYILIINCL